MKETTDGLIVNVIEEWRRYNAAREASDAAFTTHEEYERARQQLTDAIYLLLWHLRLTPR